ncbi:MAG: metal ABC transporter substrate-binding protein [Cellulosilyticaceae bacterium]
MGKKRQIKWCVWLILAVLYLCFIGYKYQQRQPKDQEGAEDTSLTVVTSSYPLYLHTKVIAEGADTQVINMVSKDVGCLHDYQLTTEDMKKIHQADVFIMGGKEEESMLYSILKQYPDLQVVNASEQWEADHVTEDTCTHTLQDDHEAHTEHEAHGENPHVWLSLKGAASQIQTITEALITQDPDYEQIYVANSKAYTVAVKQLEADCVVKESVAVMMLHDTFQYMLEDMGVKVVATLAEGSYENPSPKQVEAIIGTMQDAGARAIVTEAKYESLGILKTLKEATGCDVVVLDGVNTPATEDEACGMPYIERMKGNQGIIKGMK